MSAFLKGFIVFALILIGCKGDQITNNYTETLGPTDPLSARVFFDGLANGDTILGGVDVVYVTFPADWPASSVRVMNQGGTVMTDLAWYNPGSPGRINITGRFEIAAGVYRGYPALTLTNGDVETGPVYEFTIIR